MTMLEKMTRNWWTFAVRGLIAILFGVVALIRPGQTLQALVLVFGVFALMDGLLAVAAGIASAAFFKRWWTLLLEGLTGITIGLLTFFSPAATALALVYFIAAWGFITGIFEIVTAIQLRREITGEWMMILGGVLSIGFGVLLFAFPAAGALSAVWVIGIYALAFGVSEIVFAFRLNGFHREFLAAGD